MNATTAPSQSVDDTALWAVGGLLLAACALVTFVLLVSKYCKRSTLLYYLWFRCCIRDYNRVELGELQQELGEL